jgi:hypothetical protein
MTAGTNTVMGIFYTPDDGFVAAETRVGLINIPKK